MLRVYIADISGLDLQPAVLKLSAYRLSRLEKVKSELNKKRGIAAELLLNYAIRELCPETELPLDIYADENEKPYLRGRELFFSLSHSGHYSLCAVSDRELGADIQEQVPFKERLARRFFTAEEFAYILGSSNRDYAFSKVWALKESTIKAFGLGLKMPLNAFSLQFGEEIGIRGESWKLWHTCVSGYHVAVCSEMDGEPEIFREIEL